MLEIKFNKVNNQLLIDADSLAFYIGAKFYELDSMIENYLGDLVKFGEVGKTKDSYLLNFEHCQIILPLVAEGVQLRKVQIKVTKAHQRALRINAAQSVVKWVIVGYFLFQAADIAPRLIKQLTNPPTTQEQLAGELKEMDVKDLSY